MPEVIVGERPVKVSWGEYYLALLPKGTRVKFTKGSGFGARRKSGEGTFHGSMFHDGISGRVKVELDDAGTVESVDIFPEFGDRIRRIKAKEPRP